MAAANYFYAFAAAFGEFVPETSCAGAEEEGQEHQQQKQ